jgi:hypothetical protein
VFKRRVRADYAKAWAAVLQRPRRRLTANAKAPAWQSKLTLMGWVGAAVTALPDGRAWRLRLPISPARKLGPLGNAAAMSAVNAPERAGRRAAVRDGAPRRSGRPVTGEGRDGQIPVTSGTRRKVSAFRCARVATSPRAPGSHQPSAPQGGSRGQTDSARPAGVMIDCVQPNGRRQQCRRRLY